jgi:hypothetical protein
MWTNRLSQEKAGELKSGTFARCDTAARPRIKFEAQDNGASISLLNNTGGTAGTMSFRDPGTCWLAIGHFDYRDEQGESVLQMLDADSHLRLRLSCRNGNARVEVLDENEKPSLVLESNSKGSTVRLKEHLSAREYSCRVEGGRLVIFDLEGRPVGKIP